MPTWSSLNSAHQLRLFRIGRLLEPSEHAEAWCEQNGGLPYFETSATEGTLVEEAFQRAAERGLDNVDDDDLAMPTSLGAAAGAIKIDAADDAKRGADAQKKRKRCRDKCAIL